MPALSSVVKKQQPNDLSAVEVKVLEYLSRTLRPGFCPSREELSQAAGLGTRGSSITSTLRSLEVKGYLELGQGRSRSITLRRTADGQRFSADTVWVPLAGQAPAEPAHRTPPKADPVGEAIELTRSMLGGHDADVYAVRVHDRSLIDAVVNPGDVIVVARSSDIQNGELAALRVTGKDGRKTNTFKYYYRESGHVRLQPVHPDFPPLYYKAEQVAVLGRVMLVIRQFA